MMARSPVSLLQKLLQCSSVINETSSHYGVNCRRKYNKATQNRKKTHNSEKNAQLLFFQCILVQWSGYQMVKYKNVSILVFMSKCDTALVCVVCAVVPSFVVFVSLVDPLSFLHQSKVGVDCMPYLHDDLLLVTQMLFPPHVPIQWPYFYR